MLAVSRDGTIRTWHPPFAQASSSSASDSVHPKLSAIPMTPQPQHRQLPRAASARAATEGQELEEPEAMVGGICSDEKLFEPLTLFALQPEETPPPVKWFQTHSACGLDDEDGGCEQQHLQGIAPAGSSLSMDTLPQTNGVSSPRRMNFGSVRRIASSMASAAIEAQNLVPVCAILESVQFACDQLLLCGVCSRHRLSWLLLNPPAACCFVKRWTKFQRSRMPQSPPL